MGSKFKKSLFVFSTIFLGLFYPFISSAGWVETLKKGVGRYILFLVIKLFVNIAKFFTGLAGSLLNWVLSPDFIRWSYTNPANNEIIKTGLSVTMGFVNMLLVLILVYIAIAVILQLRDYEAKKLLPVFIIVALLVNFAPVICGLIVDASNIVMNFFVQDLKADAFGKEMTAKVEQISFTFEDRELDETGWSQIAQLAVMVPFLWVLTFILLLFTILFILRYLVIWLLVILSPLAFACYILPVTKKYFDQWWQQFINWSFIGVTAGFFLYLGLMLVTYVPTEISKPSTEGTGLFDTILPYFVSVVFLGIGFVFSLQTSAKGATTALKLAKTKGMVIGRGVTRGTLRATRWSVEKARAKLVSERMRKWGERQMGARKWGKGETGLKGFAKRAAATAIPVRYARRGLGKLVGGEIVESQQAKIQQTEKSIKDTDRTPILLKRYNKSLDDAQRIGIVNKLIEKGDIDDAMNKKKHGASAITPLEMKRIVKKAKKWDSGGKMEKSFPHVAGEGDAAKIREILTKMKPVDYKNISKEALGSTKVIDAMLTTAMGKHISQLIEQHGQVAAQAIEEGIDRGAPVNTRLKKYLTSQPGQGLISPKTHPRNWTEPSKEPPTPPSEPPSTLPPGPPLPKKTPGAPKRTPKPSPGAPKRP